MGEMFDIAELLRVGVNDEKSGVAFYSALAGKCEDAELKQTFSDLADQERFHQRRFEEMLATIGEHKSAEQYGGEHVSYLEAMTGLLAFPDEESAARQARETADDAAAVDLSLRFERDTLNLMHEMKPLVPAKDHDIMDQLINEERAHVVTLAAVAQRLKG